MQMRSSAGLLAPLVIMRLSMQVNSRTGFRVQENNFYVTQVKDIIRWCEFLNLKDVSIKSYQQCKTTFFFFSLFYLNESIYMEVNSRL